MAGALKAVKVFRMRELSKALPPIAGQSSTASATSTIVNPFLPRKSLESGRWIPAKYSLRQQADLVKKAKAAGMLHLLPSGPKLSIRELAAAKASASASVTEAEKPKKAPPPAGWEKDVQWEGEFKEKEVKGADIGARLYAGKKRMFKGHRWERVMDARMKKREVLLKSMPERIERFRTNYKRKVPNPIAESRNTSYSKLPF
ncbi:uncharacterized protein BXZ73DRAFT_41505 [Epithele typhae]|uniref:uncharacterized protein n=1 Tax=Epithele typhae TaxID=378194 RepID=UPI0020088B4B|nr:uncharacterized protein BXZ73DRAFT_41505 [Epithele typhae]KAH9941788.1 hypothetical protein BXZ73DRAFT_41505 [Epithele typhae]